MSTQPVSQPSPVIQMVQDPDFAKLSPTEQRKALSAHDPGFQQVSDSVMSQFVQAHQTPNTSPQPGEVINDVGNKVIVPKAGEDFADTMKRAAAYGRTVTPDMVSKEMASAPKKVAATLLAAPAIGAAIPAAQVGAGAATSSLLPSTYVGASTIPGAGGLGTIAAKYGIKALQAAGGSVIAGGAAHAGWNLYQDLKEFFNGK